MSTEISAELRAARSRAGKLGSASKWGGQRIVRIDSLDPRVRAAVLALVQADAAAREEAASGLVHRFASAATYETHAARATGESAARTRCRSSRVKRHSNGAAIAL